MRLLFGIQGGKWAAFFVCLQAPIERPLNFSHFSTCGLSMKQAKGWPRGQPFCIKHGISRKGKMNMSIKIAVNYEKGGVGKTCTAVNLSAVLAERGFSVLLVDLDPQRWASTILDRYDESLPSVHEVMQGLIPAAEAIRRTEYPDLDILPSKIAFTQITAYLIMKRFGAQNCLKTALAQVESSYDFILMDCPPHDDAIKDNALAAADYMLLPTIPDDCAVEALFSLMSQFAEIKQNLNPSLTILGVLITLAEQTKSKRLYAESLLEQEEFPVFRTVIRKNTRLQEAMNSHRPITVYDARCAGCQDYNALADELLEQLT